MFPSHDNGVFRHLHGAFARLPARPHQPLHQAAHFDCRERVAALGLKQVRIVVSGDSVPENQDKILKSIKKADPSSKCEFYEKTGKIVGTFAKAKMDNIKRDFKGIDPKIKVEIKNQTLK